MNLNNYLREAEKVILRTGQMIREERTKFQSSDVEYKGLNNLVSYVDKTAEQMLVEGLIPIVPNAGFFTEEETVNSSINGWHWIIDPLDGTTNFIHGIPVFAISVALAFEDTIHLGIVLEINRWELFTATSERISFCNGKPIQVSPFNTLSQSLLATGFPYYSFEKQAAYLEILRELMQQTHGLRRMGSAAVDLCYVACGRFEGFFEYNLNAWDVAAGALIVKQAGGKVTDFKMGNSYIHGREIIAAGAVHESLSAVIQKYWL